MKKLLLLILLFSFNLPAQNASRDNLLVVIGDSLVGKEINGEKVRDFISNVIITHGPVRITCDRAIQNLKRNEVELIGNVIVTQDSIILKTSRGKYFGNTRTAHSNSGVELTDGHINLKSAIADYYNIDNHAVFFGDVNFKDSVSTVTSDKLTYFNDTDITIAVGKVIVKDMASSTLYADSLYNERNTGIVKAFGRVKIFDSSQNVSIFGNTLFVDREKKYQKISGNPVFMQVDTADNGTLDTLFISSLVMEQTSDSLSKFIATDSVKILKGEFSSVNNYSILYREEGKLFTYRKETEEVTPVLWYSNSQLTGDSIYIFMEKNTLNAIDIRENALIVSDIEGYDFRYDQMSGDKLLMSFNSDKLTQVKLTGNVLSIYNYMSEDVANGLIKSSSESAVIKFENNAVSDVRLYGSPVSEYHPETVVTGKEKDFTIPSFIIRTGRPEKKLFLEKLPGKIYYKQGFN